jgi:hypothetical protein
MMLRTDADPPTFEAGSPVSVATYFVAIGYGARAWLRSEWSLASRVHYSVVVAAAVVLYWLLQYWNLLWVRTS